MTMTEIKNELIEKIKNIQDPEVIEELQRLLDMNVEPPVYKLTDDQKKEIDQARGEIRRNEGISSEEMDKEIDEWLKG